MLIRQTVVQRAIDRQAADAGIEYTYWQSIQADLNYIVFDLAAALSKSPKADVKL